MDTLNNIKESKAEAGAEFDSQHVVGAQARYQALARLIDGKHMENGLILIN